MFPVHNDFGSIHCVIQLSAMIWLYWKRICRIPLGGFIQKHISGHVAKVEGKIKGLTNTVYDVPINFINILFHKNTIPQSLVKQ